MTTVDTRIPDAATMRPPATIIAPPREPRPVPAAVAPELTPRDIFNALRYHSVLFTFVGLIVASGLAAGAWMLFPSKYTATAMVRVSSVDPTLITGVAGGIGKAEFGTVLKTKSQIIRSNKIMQRVIREPKINQLPSVRDHDDPLFNLSESVVIEYSGESEIMKVSWKAEDPAEAAAVTNAIIDSMMFEERFESDERLRTIASLQAEGDKTRTSLEAKRKQLNGGVGPQVGGDMKLANKRQRMTQLFVLQQDKSRIRSEGEVLRGRLAAADERLKQAQTVAIEMPDLTSYMERDPDLRARQMQVSQIRRQVDSLAATVADQTRSPLPELRENLRATQAALDAARDQYRERFAQSLRQQANMQLTQAAQKLREETEAITAREKANADQLKEYSDLAEADGGERAAQDLRVLENDILTTEDTLKRIETRMQNLKVDMAAPQRVTLLQKAEVPQSKEIKKQVAFTAFGAIAGFGLVGFCICGLELKRKRIYSASDPVYGTRLPLLGRVPEYGAAVPGRGEEPAGQAYHEAIDKLKAVLTRLMNRREMQIVLVTSAAPEEGKSLVAWSLALSLARTDKRTLFVDGNLVNPSLHRHYDVAAEPGLSELLRGEKGLPDVVQKTPYGNLWCIAAGQCDEAARHTLDKDRMRKFLDRCRQDFDYVVIDSCSMREAVDPLYLAQRADCTILATRVFQSRVSDVERACGRLGMLGTPLLGAVMTDSTLTAREL